MATSCTSPSVNSLWEINKHTVHLPSLLQVHKHRCSWTHQLSFYMQSSTHEITKLWTLLSHFNCGTRRFKQCTLKLYNYSWPVYLFIIYFLVWVFKKIAHEFNVPWKPRVKPSHQQMKEEWAHVTTTCLTPCCSTGDTDTWKGLGRHSGTSSPWCGTSNQLPVCPSIQCSSSTKSPPTALAEQAEERDRRHTISMSQHFTHSHARTQIKHSVTHCICYGPEWRITCNSNSTSFFFGLYCIFVKVKLSSEKLFAAVRNTDMKRLNLNLLQISLCVFVCVPLVVSVCVHVHISMHSCVPVQSIDSATRGSKTWEERFLVNN